VNPVAAGPVADVVSAFLMLFGALSCLLGAIGLVRLPDLPARLQAATKPQTLGLSLNLMGTALRVELASAVTLVLVVLFQVITAPVISQLVGRAAYRSGGFPDDTLVVDELAELLPWTSWSATVAVVAGLDEADDRARRGHAHHLALPRRVGRHAGHWEDRGWPESRCRRSSRPGGRRRWRLSSR
jgi:multicomponent Na+:H+ antiporter subunit G